MYTCTLVHIHVLNFLDCYRFIVREFVYDTHAIAAEKQEKGKLEMQLKKQFVSFHKIRGYS